LTPSTPEPDAVPDQPYAVPESMLAPPKGEDLLELLYPYEVRVRAMGVCQFLLGAGAAAVVWPGQIAKLMIYFSDPSVVRPPSSNWIYATVALLLIFSGIRLAVLAPRSRILGTVASAFSICFPPFGLLMLPAGMFLLRTAPVPFILSHQYSVLRKSMPRPTLKPSIGLAARAVLWSLWTAGGFWVLAEVAGWV
jgi:hypothetical protein